MRRTHISPYNCLVHIYFAISMAVTDTHDLTQDTKKTHASDNCFRFIRSRIDVLNESRRLQMKISVVRSTTHRNCFASIKPSLSCASTVFDIKRESV